MEFALGTQHHHHHLNIFVFIWRKRAIEKEKGKSDGAHCWVSHYMLLNHPLFCGAKCLRKRFALFFFRGNTLFKEVVANLSGDCLSDTH